MAETTLIFIEYVVASVYLPLKKGTIFRGFVSSPSMLILPSHALDSFMLVSYPASFFFTTVALKCEHVFSCEVLFVIFLLPSMSLCLK